MSDRIEVSYGHRTVTDASVSNFGTLTGDYARMHFDHHHGKALPIGGSIAHGLLSACWAVGAMTRFAPERLGVGDREAVLERFSVRFGRMVYVGDTLCVDARDEGEGTSAFEMLNQNAERVTHGSLTVSRDDLTPAPRAWELEPWTAPVGEVVHADDLLEQGPRGEGPGRTITEGELVRFAVEVGETNPLYLNREFARRSRFGARITPPMFVFCLCFSDFLDALLSMPLPSTGGAGHLGDAFTVHAPVSIGDTIRGRYRVNEVRPSRSRPDSSVVEFGLQALDQRDAVVQQGSVTMLIARRPRGS